MELRQLEAFVAVATELHFARAAERLVIGQPILTELVRDLERELGTPLFTRTTRRVALTNAGAELLDRSKIILDEVAAATAAVRRIAERDGGTVRVGITPPVAPVLAPHLRAVLAGEAPDVSVRLNWLSLPALAEAIQEGQIDVAITCGRIAESDGVISEEFCAEPLLVGLRPDHRYVKREQVTLTDLAHDVLGVSRESLFPAWAIAQRQALEELAIAPTTVDLDATDLAATRWTEQSEVDWIMLIGSLTSGHTTTVVKPIEPPVLVPFTLHWSPEHAQSTAVARFVRATLTAQLPPGWVRRPGHLHYRD
ncbi:MAG TPA: LysR family transcriptional regulator [Pseudonocardiaceae bacterium]|nr:LysR family transcriptional regulator [Pseudonocardiaceae bacterium]